MHVAIIGNGITGVTAALTLRRLQPDWKISMISGESTYHYSRPALMYVFMGHMGYRETKPYPDSHWREQRIDLVRAWVTNIDTEGKRLELKGRDPLAYDKLLIATGSQSNKFGWPGQDLPGVQGLYSLMDLKELYESIKTTRRAVLVGGGLIGVELAEMLHSRHVPVTFLVRERSYWDNVLPPEESALVSNIVRQAGIDLRLETELNEIEPGPTGRVAAVTTKGGERIECELVGLTAGVRPNVSLAKASGIECARGIVVDWSLRTRTPDVFAAGDCAELETQGDARNVIQQVWYTGKSQGECVAHVLAGEERTYDPGIWYNSAKFFDLEYHTYGTVKNVPADDEQNLVWQDPSGPHLIRLVGKDGVLIGVNGMGLRLRHRVFERWIAQKRSVRYVLEHLEEANFDPELYRHHELSIREALLPQTPEVAA